MIYGYYINLDERGEFYADVRDHTDKTVYEIHDFDIFEDGFMTDKHDMDGLHDHLSILQIIEDTDDIVIAN